MADDGVVERKSRGRPSAAQVKAREEELAARQRELDEREAALMELEAEVRTSAPSEDAPRRSRQARESRLRKARGQNDLSHQLKLGVGFKLDPDFEYRWINGGLDDQRLHDKTRTEEPGGDWQPVSNTGEEPSDSTGTVLRRAVGTNQAGQVEYAYLCRKPREYYEDDHALLQERNDKRIQAIYRGRDPNAPENEPDVRGLGYGQETKLTGQGARAIKL